MLVSTTRFGVLAIEAEDLLFFSEGMVGFENCRHWVLLADGANRTVGWLQSVDRPEVAFPVVSPRRFVPEYRVRLSRGQLATLEFSKSDRAFVLCVLGRTEQHFTLNLRAPLIVNLDRRLGRQVVTADDQPVQLPLPAPHSLLRKSA